MAEPAKRTLTREDLKKYTDQWVDELLDWSEARPDATLDEIENHARFKRREFMSQVLRVMITQHGNGYAVAGVPCPECGQSMIYKSQPGITLETREGSTRIKRAYYHCSSCGEGLFPPGSASASGTGGVE
jgi:YgiT-type zinc finger domain-containing protein